MKFKRLLAYFCAATLAGVASSCAAGSAGTDAGVDAGPTDAGPGAPRDLDVVVLRFNPDGTIDSTFADAGIARIDFGQTTGAARDSVYGMAQDSSGRTVLFGSTKATGRTDVDRVVVRLTSSGALDSAFATTGVHRLDLAGTQDSPRHGFVQGDGKIVSSGYSPFSTGVALADGGTQTANRIVLLRLESSGAPDLSFGDAGVVATPHFVPPNPTTTQWGMAEAYAVVPQSGARYVTAGYGRAAASGTVDVVSARYSNSGAQDSTWADAGTYLFDFIGGDERGRNAVSLPDDRVVIVGSGAPMAAGNVDALVSVLTAHGALDSSFDSDGVKTWSFGRADEGFFGNSLSAGALTLAAVGYRTGPANTDSENDDAVLLVLPLSSGGHPEVARPVPLSATGHDRLFGAVWDGNKIVAAGFVREGADTRIAVARFLSDGNFDTTFGNAGVSLVNVAVGAGVEETARGVVVQTDGKIVVAGVAEH